MCSYRCSVSEPQSFARAEGTTQVWVRQAKRDGCSQGDEEGRAQGWPSPL